MKLDVICDAVKDTCAALPTLSCDFSVNHEIRCKRQGKRLMQMTSEGEFEVPLLYIAAAAALLLLTAKCCMCMAELCSHCRCHGKDKR